MFRPCWITRSCGRDVFSSVRMRAVASEEPSSTKTISAELSWPMAWAISRARGAIFSASSLTGTTTERATCMLMFRSMPSYNKVVGRLANPRFREPAFLGCWRRPGAGALYRAGPQSNRAVSRRRIPPAFLIKISSLDAGHSKGVPDDRGIRNLALGLRLCASGTPAGSLLLLCLALWLPGALSLPALDRDESRFAQASKQMVETGDYVDIRFS